MLLLFLLFLLVIAATVVFAFFLGTHKIRMHFYINMHINLCIAYICGQQLQQRTQTAAMGATAEGVTETDAEGAACSPTFSEGVKEKEERL